MTKLKAAALAAASMLAATQAGAATYVWSSGTYSSGPVGPNLLLPIDTLQLVSGNTKYLDVNLVNDGLVDWQAGDLYLYGGTATNNGTWNVAGDQSLSYYYGSDLFTNNGLFSKTGGTGVTNIAAPFVNNGTINADSGAINFYGNNLTVNAGSSFTGDGAVTVSSNGTYNGAFSVAAATELQLTAGTHTGNAATYTGTVDFQASTLAGSWIIASGSTLNMTTGNTKYLSGTFVNNGDVNSTGGDTYLYGGAVTNNGDWTVSTDQGLYYYYGGDLFTNNGLFSKTGGTGVTNVAAPFVQNGVINVDSGAINFYGNNLTFNAGSSFTGDGAVTVSSNGTYNGAFSVAAATELQFTAGTQTGNAATYAGTVDFQASTLAGSWIIASGSTLNMTTGNTKYLSGTLVNNGDVNSTGGDTYLYGGTVTNNSDWSIATDQGLYYYYGGDLFTNNGVFSKTGGTGVTNINAPFVNNGTVNVDSGAINFYGNNLTVNAGSGFTGDGAVTVSSNATYNGAFSVAAATELQLTGGTQTGNAATYTGIVDYQAGTIAGNWIIASGSTMNMTTGNTKYLSGTFVNNGNVNSNGGDTYLYGGTATNNGTWSITTDQGLYYYYGGDQFTNNGLFQKTAGTGVTNINAPFVNNGTIEASSGTINFLYNLDNDGTIAGTAAVGVSNTLLNDGVIAPGGAQGAGVGTLQLNGNYVQNAGGFFDVSFGTSIADLFNISGTASLDGGLRLYCASCTVNTGDVYTILDSVGDLSGMFASTSSSGFYSGFAYSVLYDTALDRVQLRIDNAGEPPVTGAVPEPATWAMLIMGFGAVGASLRRRRARVAFA